jgi:hypothetical protein
MTKLQRGAAQLLAAVLGLVPAGCHRLPFHRVDPSIDPRELGRLHRAAAEEPPPALLADSGPGVPLPPLPLRPVTDGEILGEPAETPLLDAALVRAQAQQDALVTADVPAADPQVVRAAVVEPEPADPLPGPIRPRLEPVPEASDPAEPGPGPPPEPAIEQPPTEETTSTASPVQEAPEESQPVPEESADEVRSEEPIVATSPPPMPLSIEALRLCRRVLGFGRFEAIDDDVLRPGQVVVLYCEMAGLQYVADGAGFRSELEAIVEIRSAPRDAALWQRPLGVAKDACPKPRQDYYVNFRLVLPDAATLPPGEYRLRLTQRDRLSGAEATREMSFRVGEPFR